MLFFLWLICFAAYVSTFFLDGSEGQKLILRLIASTAAIAIVIHEAGWLS